MLYLVSRKKWHFFQEYFNTSTLKGQTTFFFDTYIFLGHACIYNDLNHKSYTYTRTCQKMPWGRYSISFQTIYASQKMGPALKICILLKSSLQNLITLEVLCNLVKKRGLLENAFKVSYRFLNQYWEVLWNATLNILAKNPYFLCQNSSTC